MTKKETDFKYRTNFIGFSTLIYHRQKNTSKRRGHNPPLYTKEELMVWLKKQDNFNLLWSNWVYSGYKTELVPSVDRLDDYKGYSLDNIQLITWEENNKKANDDEKNGINNKRAKPVLMFSIDNIFIKKYHSISQASRIEGINKWSIIRCCKGSKQYTHAGGYKWKYLLGHKRCV